MFFGLGLDLADEELALREDDEAILVGVLDAVDALDAPVGVFATPPREAVVLALDCEVENTGPAGEDVLDAFEAARLGDGNHSPIYTSSFIRWGVGLSELIILV
jgi:hypothetical protein